MQQLNNIHGSLALFICRSGGSTYLPQAVDLVFQVELAIKL
jgi:hypothetical protein